MGVCVCAKWVRVCAIIHGVCLEQGGGKPHVSGWLHCVWFVPAVTTAVLASHSY